MTQKIKQLPFNLRGPLDFGEGSAASNQGQTASCLRSNRFESEERMAKKTKIRGTASIKAASKLMSHASIYGSMLAKRVAVEMTPARSTRKKASG